MLLSGAFLLALILAGILVAVVGGGGSGHAHGRTHQQVVVRTSATRSTPISSTACTLPAGAQATPSTSPPAGTRWATVGSMRVPQAPTLYGPQRTHGAFNTCFAHDPSGALLAAMNFWSESTAAPSGTVYRHLAVHVPAAAYRTSSRLNSEGPVQWAGYRYDSYNPTMAQVSVVVSGPQGKLVAFVTPMVWTGGDWRYLFPPQGVPPIQTIADLSGYVAWSDF